MSAGLKNRYAAGGLLYIHRKIHILTYPLEIKVN